MSKTKDAPGTTSHSSNVIRVAFGAGGGRVRELQAPDGSAPASPLTRLYAPADAARVLRITPAQLKRLARGGAIQQSGPRGCYTFGDLAASRSAVALLARGIRIGAIVKAVRAAREKLLHASFSEFRFDVEGGRVVAHLRGGTFEAHSGQTQFDFASPAGASVVDLRPSRGTDRVREAYDLYLRASRIDEEPERMLEAEALYRRALELDPYLAVAYTNLGNVLFRRCEYDGAGDVYEKALALDPQQPEAQYNLGYLRMEDGQLEKAIALFLRAIECDAKFADAHFNLAVAYERTGQRPQAQRYFRSYIALEPHGDWADAARRHL